MKSQLVWLLIFLLLLLILIVITEVLHRRFKLPSEQSRKFLHVSGGLMCLLFPSIFTSHWWLLILAIIAFTILFATYKMKQLASIHQTKRYSVGSILFPIPIYFCFLMAEKSGQSVYFYLPVSLLAISDTAAETGGNLWGHHTKNFFENQKTLAGSLCFFITAILVCFVCLELNSQLSLSYIVMIALLISIITAITETVTLHGWDNLTVPAITILVLLLFSNVYPGKIN